MTEYTLHFDHLDGDTGIGPRDVEGDTAADLAQAVHRHARGYLGSRQIDIHVDAEALTGDVIRHGATVGTFRMLPIDDAPAPREEVVCSSPGHIRHGWTVDDVGRLAWGVAATDAWNRAMTAGERYDHARYGIVTHLLSSDETPSRHDLYRAGQAEISSAAYAELRYKGVDDKQDYGTVPRAAAYWHTSAANPVEERVIERIALHQVWPLLTRRQAQALSTVAACDDYQQAVEALGVTERSLAGRLLEARRKVTTAWFEHETPPRRRRSQSPARSGLDSLGRKRITVSQLEQARNRQYAGETLRAIAPDFGITPQALGALLRGDRKPAPDPVGSVAA